MDDIQKTIYVLGAGFNQYVEDDNNLKPPLINNFFQIFLKKFCNNSDVLDKNEHLFNFIKAYYKNSKKDLKKKGFNLEDIFTHFDLRGDILLNELDKLNSNTTYYKKRLPEYKANFDLNFRMKGNFAHLLHEFETHCIKSEVLLHFGRKIYVEKPIILTFNYDCILEAIIEKVLGAYEDPSVLNKTNKEIDVSYGIKFNIVNLYNIPNPNLVDRKKFEIRTKLHEHLNKLSSNWKILKLHGSINWFQPVPIDKDSHQFNKDAPFIKKEKKQLILSYDNFWDVPNLQFSGWYLDPLMITPIVNKQKYYNQKPFNKIWKIALNYLKHCKKLVIIGYSFAQADFLVRKLFLDAFKKNSLNKLIIVDIKPRNVVKIAKELTHFKKSVVVRKDLKEFLKYEED